MNETPATFHDLYTPKIIPDMGIERPKTDADMTHLKKNSIYEATRQKLMNKDV